MSGRPAPGAVRTTAGEAARRERWRLRWDRGAASYDRRSRALERRFFGETRAWLCRQARGRTLEVAVGTGLNLAHYPPDVRLSGIEWSAAMISVARRRAAGLGRPMDLRQGDAAALPFGDGGFDTVVCTFSLCCIPDDEAAIAEMLRVLRPEGRLLLADHVVSSFWPLRAVQWLVDRVSVPLRGEHYCRRPLGVLRRHDVVLERHERLALGSIERLAARKGTG